MVPMSLYQEARVHAAVEALAWCNWHPDFVEHTRRLWGATHEEIEAILEEVKPAEAA